VVAAGLATRAVHALLHHHPLPIVADDEAMQVQVETVLHGGAVDLGDQAAGTCQGGAVEAGARGDAEQFVRGGARMPATPTADMHAEFAGQRRQATLERTDHAGGDARGVPVHAHHRAKGLEPERMRQPPQQFVAPVVVDDGLADHRAQPGHALAEPRRHTAAMQGKIGAAGAAAHAVLLVRGC